jgi:hypothetical protein
MKSLSELRKVRAYSYKLGNYSDDNIETLKEIVALCREIKISMFSDFNKN